MALHNKYNGTCGGCGTKVVAGAGYLQGPPWVTFCSTCWVKVQANVQPTVIVTVAGNGMFVVTPKGYLESDLFNAYRAATDAASGHFDAVAKQKLVPAEAANTLINALHAAGFVVEVAPEVVASIQASLSAKKAAVAKASAHLAKIDSQLVNRVLFPFQRAGIEWLTSRRTALLADEMGLGKTAQALCALPFGAPVIVVCPVVAKGVWKAEIKAWRPDYVVTTLAGKDSFRWPAAGEIIVTNYEVLPSELKSVPPTGCVLIADEAHMLKNKKAKRTLSFGLISELVRANEGRAWLLTATPLLNTPPELWQVLQAADLAAEAFGTYGNFCHMFGCLGAGTWGKPSFKVRAALAKAMLRRHRLDVLPDLPSKIRSDVEVNGLDTATKALCDDVLKMIEAAGIDLENALETSNAGKMSPLLFNQISKARAALATAKIPSMLEVVEQYEDADEPLIVFSAHRAPIDLFAHRAGWAVITGDTTPEARTEIQKSFQAGELRGIAATIQAGGVALTLTHAHHALFVDLAWTPALNSQAEDRICRIGQDKGVVIKRLVASHVLDARVMALLTKKQIIIENSVEAAAVKSSSGESIEAPTLAAVVLNAEAALDALAEADYKAKKAAAKKAAAVPCYSPKLAVTVKRGPVSVVEEWAAQGLIILAALDPDKASTINGAGFNKMDGDFGHDLAEKVMLGAGLSDAQWSVAVKMMKKYHKQVGECPTEK